MSTSIEKLQNKQPSSRSLVGRDPWTTPLREIDLAHPGIWQANEYLPFLARLRRDAPIHYCADSAVGPYWSITRFQDVMDIEKRTDLFSSEPTIGIVDPDPDYILPMFIAMDPPKHDVQRKTVQGVVAPANLKNLEPLIRQRVCKILDNLPNNEPFNWVEKVSRDLTTQMLATLFDFPFEERNKLTYWSDVATAIPGAGLVDSYEESQKILQECLMYFSKIWQERASKPPGDDLISMLAHGESTRNMPPLEFLGNLILLIVGGNDTTRNSITGSVLALHQNPAEHDKLRADPTLIPSMVSETIRWQTPLAYMRRTATQDVSIQGETIKKGDKILLWYASANQDESAIENADQYIIDRPNVRQHLSFGTGIHRCMGNRLAEMQLRVLWEEILPRFRAIEVVGEPERIYSSFVKGYHNLSVVAHPH
ncbi:cytochrome P450 [Pseudohongiella nitratireducens]|uniref:cytochrome P450 n=1 Tax=Pseudohongiella nitratireducens TaxID=1768907 RepID=UPI0030ED7E26